ncbi:MAG: ADP-ribosylglycohydrolase family protein, partial [Nocardioides sp.]
MHTTAPRDLLAHELDQRRESGYELAELEDAVHAVLADEAVGDDEVLTLYRHLLGTARQSSWPYAEPDALADILATLPADSGSSPVDPEVVADQVHGAWLGRVVGCTLGKAIEWGDHWTPEHIRTYLTLAGAYPLDDYIPVLDPMPDGFELHDSWPQTTRGNVSGSARDDDIDFAMLALHVLETHGDGLRTEHVAEAWLTLLPYLATYTAERAAYRNLVDL